MMLLMHKIMMTKNTINKKKFGLMRRRLLMKTTTSLTVTKWKKDKVSKSNKWNNKMELPRKNHSNLTSKSFLFSIKLIFKAKSTNWPKPNSNYWMFWFQKIIRTSKSKDSILKNMTKMAFLFPRSLNINTSWRQAMKVSLIDLIMFPTSRLQFMIQIWSRTK